MANFVVWLDLRHAKLFELNQQTVDETSMYRREVHHHSGYDKEKNNHKNEEKFFHEIASHLVHANEILVIGPGEAKGHFRQHLEQHHHQDLSKKVIGVETVDHPTDGQIVALAKKLFKAHRQFE